MDSSAMIAPSARHLAGRYRRARLSGPVVAFWTVLVDMAVLGLAAWFALYATGGADFSALGAAGQAAILAAMGLLLMAALRGYRVAVMRARIASAAAMLPATVLPIITVAPGSDLGNTALAATLAALLGPVPYRLAVAGWLRWAGSLGLMERRAVLVGGGEPAREVIEGLDARPGNDIRVCAIFDDRSGARSPDLVLDVPRIGGFEELVGFARAAEIDLVIITIPAAPDKKIDWLLHLFADLPVPVHLSAFSRGLTFPGALRPLVPGTFGPDVRLLKRALDLSVGLLALAILWPIMLAAAVAVRLEGPGPILFRQWRTGFAGRPVEVLKFRTMRHEAADPKGRAVVRRGDDRVTRIGRVLRRSSIDELPQLFNVIRGELSLVGPRPHAIDACSAREEAFDALVAGYGRRHRLPPGLTGWAQVNGWRGTIEETDHLKARVDHDLWYIANWSLWLDLWILLRTPLSLLRTRNAF